MTREIDNRAAQRIALDLLQSIDSTDEKAAQYIRMAITRLERVLANLHPQARLRAPR